jgi:hypothetical protein
MDESSRSRGDFPFRPAGLLSQLARGRARRTALRRLRGLLSASVIFCTSSALAHQFDCKGNAVEPRTKSCCGQGDALLLQADKVTQDDNGVWHAIVDGEDHRLVDTYSRPIEMLPSQDGCYWVWYRRQDTKGQYPEDTPHDTSGPKDYHFYCFQGPYPT